MPYARVGAMPQPSKQNAHQKRKQRGSRKQGITMEDLKKQTALRLAQEQKQNGLGTTPPVPTSRDRGAFQASFGQKSTTVSSGPYARSADVPARPAQVPYNVQMPLQNIDNPSLRSQHLPPESIVGYPSGRVQPTFNPTHSSSSGSSSSFGSPTRHESSSSLAQRQSAAKSKLPHGLTVQELKEMTKARLHAEAAERSETETQNSSGSFQRGSPLPEITSVSTSRSVHHPQVRSDTMLTPSQIPPGPPGFQITSSAHPVTSNGHDLEHNPVQGLGGISRETWHQQSKVETWETASAASAGSEYLGSESAYSTSGTGQPQDEFNEVSFMRSSSYPSGSGLGAAVETESLSSLTPGSAFYDVSAALAPNRRRACTLSPRAGLSHLHEDRPLDTGMSELTMPSFDSPPHPIGYLRSSQDNRSRNLGAGGNIENFSIAGNFNRARTASAPSLPSGHGFSGDSPYQVGSGSFFGRPSAVDNVSNSVVESLWGSSSRPVNDLSSVFRTAASFDGNTLPNHGRTSESALLGGNNSSGGPWRTASADPLLSSAASIDEVVLSRGFGSLLQLSGNEDRERDGGLVSKMDQEVSLGAFDFTRGMSGFAPGNVRDETRGL